MIRTLGCAPACASRTSHATHPRARVAAMLIALASPLAAERAILAAEPAAAEDTLARGIDRETAVRTAIARNPGLKGAHGRARAMRTMSESEGRLPDPELMFDVWQVPIARPYALGDSQMISVGVKQAFPAPGSLSARAESRDRSADAEEAMAQDRARDLTRDVEHAYVDLVEATARHEAHLRHRDVAAHVVRVAEARQSTGGSLDEVARAELELARLDADVAMEEASASRARVRLNALLARPLDAPLGPPAKVDPEWVRLDTPGLTDRARATRPELRAAEARVAAERANLRSAAREATLPSFSLGALYFAPTSVMPQHGYGVTATASLPWLWGGNGKKREAEEALVRASGYDAAEARLRVDVDVGTAAEGVRAAAARLQALRNAALPAAKRSFEVSLATAASSRGDLLALVQAEREVVATEIDVVAARAALDHALAELDWAVGAIVPRAPLDVEAPHGH